MKLLIVTQVVDDKHPVLGFFCRWIIEFAKHSEEVTVICLQAGSHNLPENVRVLSLGKEEGVSRLTYLWRFFKYIWQERPRYDSVFVHMNHGYVILGALLWRMLGKQITLWYAHGHVPPLLRLAEVGAHRIVTSTKSGFRLPSRKTRVVGQGIDTEQFSYCYQSPQTGAELKLISVGRISPIKKYEILIEAISLLQQSGTDASLKIIGDVGLESQADYFRSLKKLVADKDLVTKVEFVGAVPNTEIKQYLCQSHLFVNPSETGSLDKSGVEAMATGLPVLTCNEAYYDSLKEFEDLLLFKSGEASDLADKIKGVAGSGILLEVSNRLREIVHSDHSVVLLIPKILNYD